MREIDGFEGGRLEGVAGERAKIVVRKVYDAKPAETGELTELHGLNAVVRQVQDLRKYIPCRSCFGVNPSISLTNLKTGEAVEGRLAEIHNVISRDD